MWGDASADWYLGCRAPSLARIDPMFARRMNCRTQPGNDGREQRRQDTLKPRHRDQQRRDGEIRGR